MAFDPRAAFLTDTETPPVDQLIDRIDDGCFEGWYRERVFRRNIQQGQSYFNGPPSVPAPERHAPGSLLQCHRRRYYAQLNAPKERTQPHGMFWFGSTFEERIAIEFLRDVAQSEGAYVRNDLWIDFDVETDAGTLRIKGATDPVFVDAESNPLLLTEIKTTSAVENIEEPREHHLAQVHAYLYGLSEQYDGIDEAVLLYTDRETFESRPFHVCFDPTFWSESVLTWASDHTTYRLSEELPPDNPRYNWECSYCDYAHRCGRRDETEANDSSPEGFLSNFEYPREQVIEYLEAHDDSTLTPTLAEAYPELTETYDVSRWTCEACAYQVPFDAVDEDERIQCPQCRSRGIPAHLVPEEGI